MRKQRVPKYRHHKGSGQAVVTIDGKSVYLGLHGSPDSHRRYAEEIEQWHRRNETPVSDLTVGQLTVLYLQWAKSHYVKNGKPTSKLHVVQSALRALNQNYRQLPAIEFTPRCFVAVRESLIERGTLARTTVNDYMGIIRRLVKWSVAEELLPPERLVALQAVADLKRGRSAARETERVKPVPDAFVDAIREHVRPNVWAMIELQRWTGMRPGEVTIMRARDINTSGSIWEYVPESHKTEHHGRERVVCLGRNAQRIIKERLTTNLDAYLFSSDKEGNRPYRRDSYRTAIARACKLAEVPVWSPNRLRHNFATLARKEFGIEAARVVLGHSSAVTSEIYAERDLESARAVVAKLG